MSAWPTARIRGASCELLAEIATGTPGVAPDPAPAVVFLRLGVSSLDFGIRAWTSNFDDWVSIRTELTVRVYDTLRAEGIDIAFPQQDLHLRSVSPEASAQFAATRPSVYAAPTQGTAPVSVADTAAAPPTR